MPSSGPHVLPAARRASDASASATAPGLATTTALGPPSNAGMRARYAASSATAVIWPVSIAARRSVMDASWTSTRPVIAAPSLPWPNDDFADVAVGRRRDGLSRHRGHGVR